MSVVVPIKPKFKLKTSPPVKYVVEISGEQFSEKDQTYYVISRDVVVKAKTLKGAHANALKRAWHCFPWASHVAATRAFRMFD